MSQPPAPHSRSLDDMVAYMAAAVREGRVGEARKSRPVDARHARPGEVIVTIIKDEGKETTSRPAVDGDWVVRNRCEDTGNEEYLVAANTFDARYRALDGGTADGVWRRFTPTGKVLRYTIVPASEPPFTFKAPWGEDMVAKAGDALVQDPENERDVYRVAKASFVCTYEVVVPQPLSK